jgi:hypothetical protein
MRARAQVVCVSFLIRIKGFGAPALLEADNLP